jgi:hypothetical protein
LSTHFFPVVAEVVGHDGYRWDKFAIYTHFRAYQDDEPFVEFCDLVLKYAGSAILADAPPQIFVEATSNDNLLDSLIDEPEMKWFMHVLADPRFGAKLSVRGNGFKLLVGCQGRS